MDELVVGTYEGFLLGYIPSTNEDNKFKQTFATQSHTGSVRSITVAGKFLASGGTDDKIIVIDMKTRKEHTVLMHHDGTVNALSFTNGGTHLISGGDDGKLVVTRVGNWQIEKVWKKAHEGQPVNAIAIHPSDKLALTIGGDKTLRTWNLIKGRPAFTINLASKGVTLATDLMFAPEADRFSIISQQTVDVWTISKAGIEKRITCNSKPSSLQWLNDDKLIIGLDNGNILLMNISDTKAITCTAHKQRVKCISYVNNVLYSASSAGEIKSWSLSESHQISELNTASAGCRITCMTINRQKHLIKNEDKSDEEVTGKGENVAESKNSAGSEDELSKEESSFSAKEKRSYVRISYEDEEVDPEPLKKKPKPKKRNKKQRNKANIK